MRILTAPEVAAWVRDELLNPARERPIVAVTTRPHDGDTWIDPDKLDEAIGNLADVVLLETGDATWDLTEAMPPRLDAYGGAVRVWWPGLTVDSNPYDHKLHFVRSAAEARTKFGGIVAAIWERAGERRTMRQWSKSASNSFAEPTWIGSRRVRWISSARDEQGTPTCALPNKHELGVARCYSQPPLAGSRRRGSVSLDYVKPDVAFATNITPVQITLGSDADIVVVGRQIIR